MKEEEREEKWGKREEEKVLMGKGAGGVKEDMKDLPNLYV